MDLKGLSLSGGTTTEADGDEMPDMDNIPDMSDDEGEGVVEEEDEAAVKVTTPAASGNKTLDAATDKLIQVMRTYDCAITYDKYYQTPRMWLAGYDEVRWSPSSAGKLTDASPRIPPHALSGTLSNLSRTASPPSASSHSAGRRLVRPCPQDGHHRAIPSLFDRAHHGERTPLQALERNEESCRAHGRSCEESSGASG